jgi:hypothetical protein
MFYKEEHPKSVLAKHYIGKGLEMPRSRINVVGRTKMRLSK